jgi:aldose 1-epimerase
MMPQRKDFQLTINGKPVDLFVLDNGYIQVAVTNYGGRIVYCRVPDKNGKTTDVVTGFNSLTDYLSSTEKYYGALIGRFANRIRNAQFELDGIIYKVTANKIPHQLHGGKKGFQDVVWDADQPNKTTLTLHYLSADGEEGFPGNLSVTVTYSLINQNELHIEYAATTDKKTVINFTAHPFFNLNGEGSGTINDHVLTIFADHYTPVDEAVIANGEIAPVINTPFDFRTATVVGKRLNDAHEQLRLGFGYDHNFVLNKELTTQPQTAAIMRGDQSGITMEVLTTEPGLQFYSGNFMEGKNIFKSGVKDNRRTAFSLEAQHFPDSPNIPHFPSTVLNPGDKYFQHTIYKFSTT